MVLTKPRQGVRNKRNLSPGQTKTIVNSYIFLLYDLYDLHGE